jgi:hypothetical protein
MLHPLVTLDESPLQPPGGQEVLTNPARRKVSLVMARTTIRIELPASRPDDLVALIDAITKESDRINVLVPNSSPVPAALITSLKAAATSAKADRLAAKDHERQAQVSFEKANATLGLAKGQSIRSGGTGLNLIARARDLLLALNLGKENALEPFGFKVVVGSAAAPVKKTTAK